MAPWTTLIHIKKAGSVCIARRLRPQCCSTSRNGEPTEVVDALHSLPGRNYTAAQNVVATAAD